jgi:hypothetical protein
MAPHGGSFLVGSASCLFAEKCVEINFHAPRRASRRPEQARQKNEINRQICQTLSVDSAGAHQKIGGIAPLSAIY